MSKKITMTAGHGGTDPGAVGNGYQEHALAWDFIKRVKKYLQDNYIRVNVTIFEEKNAKGQFLASYGTAEGIYLSFHFNASTNINASGTEVLQGKYGTKYINEVSAALSRHFRPRGIKQANTDNFYMLREAGFDGIVEICFISNKGDMDYYIKNKDNIVASVAEAIASEAGLTKKSISSNTNTTKAKQTWILEKFTSKNGNTIHYTPYKIGSKHRFKIIGANTQANAKKYNCPYMRYMKDSFLFEALVDTNCYSNKPCTKKSGKFLKGERFYGNYAGQIKR